MMADLDRALVGIATMKAVPLLELMDVLEAIVFNPANMSLRVQSQAVREQAMLSLGAMVTFCLHNGLILSFSFVFTYIEL